MLEDVTGDDKGEGDEVRRDDTGVTYVRPGKPGASERGRKPKPSWQKPVAKGTSGPGRGAGNRAARRDGGTLLTREMIEQVRQMASVRASVQVISAALDITPRTFYNWLQSAKDPKIPKERRQLYRDLQRAWEEGTAASTLLPLRAVYGQIKGDKRKGPDGDLALRFLRGVEPDIYARDRSQGNQTNVAVSLTTEYRMQQMEQTLQGLTEPELVELQGYLKEIARLQEVAQERIAMRRQMSNAKGVEGMTRMAAVAKTTGALPSPTEGEGEEVLSAESDVGFGADTVEVNNAEVNNAPALSTKPPVGGFPPLRSVPSGRSVSSGDAVDVPGAVYDEDGVEISKFTTEAFPAEPDEEALP